MRLALGLLLALAGGWSLPSSAAAQSPPGPASYVYDDAGRLRAVVDEAGNAAVYTYDAVGNLQSIEPRSQTATSILQFRPAEGPPGTSVTLWGTGLSTDPGQEVAVNGVPATVASATPTRISFTVPGNATTGPINVTTPAGTAQSDGDFVVTSASNSPVIITFTPTIGMKGNVVEITGSNFMPAPVDNLVQINTVQAAVLAATTTTLTAIVPNAATSGRFSVTTPYGTTVSAQEFFFIPPEPYTPTNVAYVSFIAFGVPKVVAVATSGQIAMLVFDGTAGQRVSLKVASSTLSNTTLTIQNPGGTTFLTDSFGTSGKFIDVQTLLFTGTHSVIIDPSGTNTGYATFTLHDVPDDVTGTITPGGSAVVVTTSTPGQNAGLTFSGAAGQRVSLDVTSTTFGSSLDVSIVNPDGSTLDSKSIGSGGGFLDESTLPATGTYSIPIDPNSSNFGHATFTLHDVASDVTGTITPGGAPVTVTTTIPGQNAELSFSSTAGKRVSLNVTSTTFGSNLDVSIVHPSGWTLDSKSIGGGGGFMDVTSLTATGTYSIPIDPNSTNVGHATFTLYDVPADVTSTITPGGAPVTVTTSTPGQNAMLTFSGTAGNRVSLNVTSTTFGSGLDVTIVNPNGSTLDSKTIGSSGAFMDVSTLPTTGTFSIVIDPNLTNVGHATFTLYDVPADVTDTITPGGAPVTATTTTPGQNATLTFSGTAGNRVSLNVTSTTFGSNLDVSIVKPNGSTLDSKSIGSSGAFMDVSTLPTTGTYTIVIDPNLTNVGHGTFTLYDVPADVTGTMTIGGVTVTATISTPGQNAALTLSGTSGQTVTVRITGNTVGSITVKLLKPDGSSLASSTSSNSSFNLAQKTLGSTGTYTVTIDPSGAGTGGAGVRVTSP